MESKTTGIEPDSVERASVVTGSRITLSIPQSILRMTTQPVPREFFGSVALRALVEEMWACMIETGGVGIAAPQVGISWRLFIGSLDGQLASTVFVNPHVSPVDPGADLVPGEEGCLSIPGWRSKVVPRHAEVDVTYQDVNGVSRTGRYAGYAARIIQHEFDHLNGVLYIDHDQEPDRDDSLRRRARKAMAEMEARIAAE